MILDMLWHFWEMTARMAPWLLLGFAATVPLALWLTPAWVERHLGGRGTLPVLKAVALGVPLPLCSCSVLPVTVALRQHGTGKGAATAFLLSTPQTGVDSFLATWSLLGPVVALFRVGNAIVTGLLGGWLVSWADPEPVDRPTMRTAGQVKPRTFAEALRYAFINLPGEIAVAILFGLVVTAAIGALFQEPVLQKHLGHGLVPMLLMLALSIPLYVCATGSIPLAAGFVMLGASPGTALVFLIAGPATNAAALAVLWKVLGRKTTLLYAGIIAVTALAAGLGLDAMIDSFQLKETIPAACHGQVLHWYEHLAAGLFLSLLAIAWWQKRHPRRQA
jgi:uncharacterized membrane protein YraQ (UPF0718 family)